MRVGRQYVVRLRVPGCGFEQGEDGFHILHNEIDLIWFESGDNDVQHMSPDNESRKIARDAVLNGGDCEIA